MSHPAGEIFHNFSPFINQMSLSIRVSTYGYPKWKKIVPKYVRKIRYVQFEKIRRYIEKSDYFLQDALKSQTMSNQQPISNFVQPL